MVINLRCKACNVDLGEGYTVCPLCGEKATYEDVTLKNIKAAEYPKYASGTTKKKKIEADFPQKYFIRISMFICVILFIVSLFSAAVLFEKVVPAILIVNAAFCFVCGLLEKGRLLHSSVALLSVFAFSVVFGLLGLFTKLSATGILVSLAVCAALFIILFAVKPQRLKEQMKALFSI